MGLFWNAGQFGGKYHLFVLDLGTTGFA